MGRALSFFLSWNTPPRLRERIAAISMLRGTQSIYFLPARYELSGLLGLGSGAEVICSWLLMF
jgi:hypothetical protein